MKKTLPISESTHTILKSLAAEQGMKLYAVAEKIIKLGLDNTGDNKFTTQPAPVNPAEWARKNF